MIKLTLLQYAIDVKERERALKLANLAVENQVTLLEAGHLLIKSIGLEIISDLKSISHSVTVVADMKTMDMGDEEVSVAAEAGADSMIVCAAASDKTLEAAIASGRRNSVKIMASLMGVKKKLRRALEVQSFGVDYIIARKGIDEEYEWSDRKPFSQLKRMLRILKTPLVVGGSINQSNIDNFKDMGFHAIIVGRGITMAPDAALAIKALSKSLGIGLKGVRDVGSR